MNKIDQFQKYKELKQILSEKRRELKIRKERLQFNLIVGVCQKSIKTQKEEISYLEALIDNLEYIHQHDLYTIK